MSYDVGSLFIHKEGKITMSVLSVSCVGVHCDYYCILENDGYCWNAYHSDSYIREYYNKLEIL